MSRHANQKYEEWRSSLELDYPTVKDEDHNTLLRFFMGYRYELKEVNMRFKTFYDWKLKANLDAVRLENYPELHNPRPYIFIGESKSSNPIILLRANKLFPQTVKEDDLIKYIGKFIFGVLDR